jgi:hypothetical protein
MHLSGPSPAHRTREQWWGWLGISHQTAPQVAVMWFWLGTQVQMLLGVCGLPVPVPCSSNYTPSCPGEECL